MPLLPAVAPQAGRADYFSGDVLLQPIIRTPEAPHVVMALVRFATAARTFWHTHPLGQTLHVQSGLGVYQPWGEAAILLKQGDTVYIPAGEKHWHGARAESEMTHFALQPEQDGVTAVWLEAVSEEQYAAALSGQ
jgi:quercetin dioxygenase-like cupin family protein